MKSISRLFGIQYIDADPKLIGDFSISNAELPISTVYQDVKTKVLPAGVYLFQYLNGSYLSKDGNQVIGGHNGLKLSWYNINSKSKVIIPFPTDYQIVKICWIEFLSPHNLSIIPPTLIGSVKLRVIRYEPQV